MEFTRRDLGKIAIASVPLSRAFAAKMIDSKFGGVQIGAITYSFNRIASPDPGAIIKAYVKPGFRFPLWLRLCVPEVHFGCPKREFRVYRLIALSP